VIVFFGGEFNPLDKYWQAGFRAAICALAVVPAKAGTHSHDANCRSKTNGYRLKSRGRGAAMSAIALTLGVPAFAGTTAQTG
jgi:hypothetical protein